MVRFSTLYLSLAVTTAASPAAAQLAPVPVAAPAVIFVDAPPPPLAGVAATYVAPLRDSDGRYVTPNRDLSADETVWHVRVALNVAALACRDADGATVAAYNALLTGAQAPLAAAQAGMTLRYKARYGADWQARQDDRMTKLYNFFAQTVAHDDFCVTAQRLLRESTTIEPSAFAGFSAAALPMLEAPFLAFFARYDGYRVDLARWQARTAPRMVIAAASTPSVAPAPAPAPTAIAAEAAPHRIGPGEP